MPEILYLDAAKPKHPMGPLEALSIAGNRIWRLWHVLFLYYFCNVAAAVILIAPIAALLMSRLGHSLENDRLFTHFDISFLVETFRTGTVLPAMLTPLFLIGGAIYMVMSTFLTGGAIGIMFYRERSFFAECARYFPRLFRLMLWSLPAYGLVVLFNGMMTKALTKLAEDSMQSHTWVMFLWARVAVVLLLVGLVNMVFDWAKILVIGEQRRTSFWAAVDGLRFVLYSPVTTIGIFVLGQMLGIAFLLAYHGLSEVTPDNTFVMVLLMFALRQAYTLARFWLRLLVWDADVLYYQALVPEVEPEPIMPEPYASFSSTIVAPVPPSEGAPG